MKKSFGGTTEEGFEEIENVFKKNFADGWEQGGAAFACFHQGKVTQVFGGYADKSCRRLWRENTLTTIFSCTKSVAAICMAILVDRGYCDYDDKVVKYWPEFGQNGKEEITIQMVMSHRAGLPYFKVTKKLSVNDLNDYKRMSTIIEQEKPLFTPDSRTAYQPFCYGWIVDQIFCRIDPEKRNIGQFFRQEIGEKHHIDLFIGDCAEEEYRMARLTDINQKLAVREIMYDKKNAKIAAYFYNPKGNFFNALKNMQKLRQKPLLMYNNPESRLTGQPAVNGVATPLGLAQTHFLLMDGQLISKPLLDRISTPVYENDFDHSIGEEQSKGYGFMYTKSPTGSWQLGHTGVGGQIVKMDRDNGIVLAYLTNAMKAGSGEHVITANRLTKCVYECAGKKKKSTE